MTRQRKKQFEKKKENYGDFLGKIRQMHKTAQKNDKFKFLSLLAGHFSRSELKELGFNFCNRQYSRALEFSNNQNGRDWFKKKPSQITRKQNEKDLMIQFLLDHSSPSPNETVIINKTMHTVHYIDCCYACEYRHFVHKYSKLISYSTFCRWMPKFIKKKKKKTDMCPTCHKGRNLERKTKRSRSEEKELREVKRHRVLKEEQRDEYKRQIENLTEGNSVIVMDYKQNVSLGGSSVELSSDFYNRPQRTVFNIAVFTGNKKLDHFTFLSSDLKHTPLFAIEAFKQMVNHREFQNLGIKNISVWMDGAKHFRAFELMNFFHSLKLQNVFDNIVINYFAPYHGKNICDSHFSVVTHYLKKGEKRRRDPLISTSELKDLLEQEFTEANLNQQVLKRRRAYQTSVHFLNTAGCTYENNTVEKLEIRDFSYYFKFEIGNSEIKCSKRRCRRRNTRKTKKNSQQRNFTQNRATTNSTQNQSSTNPTQNHANTNSSQNRATTNPTQNRASKKPKQNQRIQRTQTVPIKKFSATETRKTKTGWIRSGHD